MKIKAHIEALRKAYPRHSPKTQQLYYYVADTKRKPKEIVVHTLLESMSGRYGYRPILIKKAEHRSPAEWRAWLDRNFENVMANGILPHAQTKSGEQWHVVKVLGWSIHTPRG